MVKERKETDVLTNRNEDGYCALHDCVLKNRQIMRSLIKKTMDELGVEDPKTAQGDTADDLHEDEEDRKREEEEIKEQKKEVERERKRERKQEEDEERERRKELDKKLKELEKIEQKKQEMEAEEEQKRKPLVLLLVLICLVIGLYILFKIGIATGATKKAAQAYAAKGTSSDDNLD